MLQEMNIEDVDKTMDEISDAQDQMQQMNDVLAQPIGGAADLDDDELAAELAVRRSNMHVQCATPHREQALSSVNACFVSLPD